MDSILNTVKKFIGFDPEYTVYDPDIILLINSELSTLYQVGVGPKDKAFRIEDSTATWDDFIENKTNIESVKDFISLRVKMIFDPPQNSFVLDAYKAKAEELLWRLNITDDSGWKKLLNTVVSKEEH